MVCIDLYGDFSCSVNDNQATVQTATKVRCRVKDQGEQINIHRKGKQNSQQWTDKRCGIGQEH